MLLARLRLPSGRLVAVATLVLLALLQLPSHVGAPLGWREATEWVTTQTRGEDAIIAFDFSLVEEFDLDDVANPSFTPYFTAPALVYGVTQPVLPLPLGEGPEVDAYLNRVFSELTTHETIALVTNFRIPPPDYRAVFRERLVDLGYVETVGPTGRFVAAAIYRR